MSADDWLSDEFATATLATVPTVKPESVPSVAAVAAVTVATAPERDLTRYCGHWRKEWESERRDFAKRRNAALNLAVEYWNGSIGDFRTVDDLLKHLTADDLNDRELMTLPALSLYCLTVFGNG